MNKTDLSVDVVPLVARVNPERHMDKENAALSMWRRWVGDDGMSLVVDDDGAVGNVAINRIAIIDQSIVERPACR